MVRRSGHFKATEVEMRRKTFVKPFLKTLGENGLKTEEIGKIPRPLGCANRKQRYTTKATQKAEGWRKNAYDPHLDDDCRRLYTTVQVID